MPTPRARRKKLNKLSYFELFDTLSARLHTQVGERVAWAVAQLTTMDGSGPFGTKGFIEDRAKQLMIDSQIVGFSDASKRFRAAVLRRRG